ncbi:phospholipase D-like domain-containing protein [Nitrospirillum sp. BR 11828]|uniref:phospholipase D-like domain-containing protein n=1 Tax=Nitrospirillum sp. BR 11828 TaxID=3104325 RepID=UPI002ACADD53|nr:phospholipase D-like domain-containing protein [Nitrospirillum sp. BR 11828]MDZ5649431.1 phospholipase D-like domain-containing protein [Nitrospirillum sp. BR 11828]
MIEALDGAREVAQVCAFLLADKELAEAMLRAAERNVRVYALTASEQRIGKLLREDDGFDQRMAEEHKRLLDQLAGKVLVRSAEHFHAKFLVVDAHDPVRSVGFLSTANFNRALHENIELGVRLQGNDAAELAAYFNWAFWCEAERELTEKGRLLPVPPPPGQPKVPAGPHIVGTLRSRLVLRETVLSMIGRARRHILLSTYGIEWTHEATQALLEALRQNVQVTIMTRPRPAVSAAVSALAEAGATIVGHDKLHAKALVTEESALVMSANLETGGLDHGFEVGVVLSGRMADGIEATLRQWEQDFPWVFRGDAMRGEHLGDFLPVDHGLRDGMIKVTQRHDQKCPDQIAPDALRLTEVPRPRLNPAPRPGEVPQHIAFTWVVVPPRLPKNAKPRQPSRASEGNELPIYDHGGKAYVLVQDDVKTPEAQRLAKELSAIVVVP